MDVDVTQLGNTGIFIVLALSFIVQISKMWLEYKGKLAPMSDDGVKSLLAKQAKSYDELLSSMKAYFEDGKDTAKKVNELHAMHNVRRNGTYAWFPHDQTRILGSLENVGGAVNKYGERHLEMLRELKASQDSICLALQRKDA